MAYKDILVYLDDGKSNIERMRTAFSLARESQARLTGVTLSRLKPAHLNVSDEQVLAIMCEQEAEKRASSFVTLAQEVDVDATTRIIHGGKTVAAERLAQVARNYDLLILRQANLKNPNHEMVEEIAQKVIRLSGRPIMFIPYIGVHRMPCKKVIIAWDGTPSATRAVHDALPILKTVSKVIVLVVKEGKQKTTPGELLADDLASHLQQHGVNAVVKRTSSGTFNVQTVILNNIAENDIDLLVMGGYGTPSIKQKVFGGVTRSLLSSMTIPVLMSH